MVWVINKPEFSDSMAIIEEIHKQTDRGTALIATAYIEEKLLAALKARMNNDEDIERELFRGSGALGTFSSRIHLGYMLGIYSIDVHKILHKIRTIRNEFAHEASPIDFNSQKIKDLCHNISIKAGFDIHEIGKTEPTKVGFHPADNSPREIFLNTIRVLTLLLGMETKTLPLRKPAPPVLEFPLKS